MVRRVRLSAADVTHSERKVGGFGGDQPRLGQRGRRGRLNFCVERMQFPTDTTTCALRRAS